MTEEEHEKVEALAKESKRRSSKTPNEYLLTQSQNTPQRKLSVHKRNSSSEGLTASREGRANTDPEVQRKAKKQKSKIFKKPIKSILGERARMDQGILVFIFIISPYFQYSY